AAGDVGAMILGVALYQHFGVNGILFPLVVRAFGLLASIVGTATVDMKDEDTDPMDALDRGFLVSSLLTALGLLVATRLLLSTGNSWWLFGAGLVGMATAHASMRIARFSTADRYRPVKELADACRSGPATCIVSGLTVALQSTVAPVLAVSVALIAAFKMGQLAVGPHGGQYGAAVATMGMLATAAYVLALDAFGSISAAAAGIAAMSGQSEEIRRRTDRLDAAGRATRALARGYAVAGAALAVFLLVPAYLHKVQDLLRSRGVQDWRFTTVDLAKVEVLVAALLGAVLVYLFSALAVRAVNKTAGAVVDEVRRQLREDEGISKGTSKPDVATCVDVAVRGALLNMAGPALLAVALPVLVGWALGREASAAFLMAGAISGLVLATFLNTGGGAWDSARRYIETGLHDGKGSDAHGAAVVGDMVGRPCTDTAGPSVHVLIKLLATVTLVLGRARSREVHPQHGGGRLRDRGVPVHHRRRRGDHAADQGALRHPQAARRDAWHHGADQGRPGGQRVAADGPGRRDGLSRGHPVRRDADGGRLQG
ncbi:MAG: sodium/proton-translocating pyrophosphatase, partial [Candidatus Riflebacteria bacterium]|nr:sodium/proton-translocating pyrophosphatase [Candidatus Riflebacteria bacterium]